MPSRRPGAAGRPAALRAISRASLRGPAIAVTAALLIGRLGLCRLAHAAQRQEKTRRSRERSPAAIPTAAPALITRYGCGGCHAIPGVPGADGAVAAPLGGLRKRVFVAGVVLNTPDNLVRWIVQPQSVSPQTAMPATGITEREARDVAAYLYAH